MLTPDEVPGSEPGVGFSSSPIMHCYGGLGPVTWPPPTCIPTTRPWVGVKWRATLERLQGRSPRPAREGYSHNPDPAFLGVWQGEACCLCNLHRCSKLFRPWKCTRCVMARTVHCPSTRSEWCEIGEAWAFEGVLGHREWRRSQRRPACLLVEELLPAPCIAPEAERNWPLGGKALGDIPPPIPWAPWPCSPSLHHRGWLWGLMTVVRYFTFMRTI